MSIGMGILVFFVSLITLIAEFILYFIFGFGAAFSGGISSLEGTAFTFVGLMILTGSIGVLFPLCAIAATLSKKQNLWTKIFLCMIGLIFIGYFFVLPASTKKIKKVSTPPDAAIAAPHFQVKDKNIPQEAHSIVQDAALSAQTADIPPTETAEMKYIKDSLVLKDIKIVDGYGQFDVPGYSATKKAVSGTIKNIGDKSIKYLELTIYFLDSNNTRISEKSAAVISTENIFDPTPPLKPNYTKDFGVIIQEDIPSDWAGKIDVEISKIEFHLQ